MNYTRYYTCTLLSDVILNKSLATEGNIHSLDYIPGSNFLGIVASSLYAKNVDNASIYPLVHDGSVLFGDAYIAKNQETFPMPFSVYATKEKNHELSVNNYLHHHLIDHPLNDIQLQQRRAGYIDRSGNYFHKLEKSFSLKSAYDSAKRRSADARMFGLESISKGQKFIFYIKANDEKDLNTVEEYLIGHKRLGKSKGTEYGEVLISALNGHEIIECQSKKNNSILIYAASNICFIDALTGQPTLQPDAAMLGFPGGTISWQKSQVRTYVYAPWNSRRMNNGMQRNCIIAGSVFYVELAQTIELKSNTELHVGEYINEGLGRIIINPSFLIDNVEGNLWTLPLQVYNAAKDKDTGNTNNDLNNFLKQLYDKKQGEIKIAKKVVDIINNDKYKTAFQHVSTSQWGKIRQYAGQYNMDQLIHKLFYSGTNEDESKNKGELHEGIPAERYWTKYKERAYHALKEILENQQYNELGSPFIAKLASELAKVKQKKQKQNNDHDSE